MIEAVAGKFGRVWERPDRLRIAALSRLAMLTGVDIETNIRLISGQIMRILLPDVVSVNLAYDGVFEPEVAAMMEWGLPYGGTFFDVGAHFGACSLKAVSLGALQVVAFEPAPKNLRMLRKNCSQLDGVIIIDKAVSDKSGTKLKMQIFGTRHCASNTLANPRLPERIAKTSSRGVIAVETVTIDDFCCKQQIAPGLIKMDVENHTRQVLEGAGQTLEKYHPPVIVETGGWGSVVRDDLKVLIDLGYGIWRWTNSGFVRDLPDSDDERNVLAAYAASPV
ncbi:MAG: methyltransferase FkbM family protein [Candidatus Amesbacteria bacterium GW2011_GWA2_42_12]|uniref:Methyltransferase FkbM family protein n=1 Tax=Candidatus Amesbacteria bacterium GW2011_GWA2_42_12 TaxID=1618356 RepID=A0A0G0Y5Q2_9BACT|nr:MAG: methyltransferase FkbM family protein [Candidatus Amesbacteria bacterium GW2011_GWA2_42_12]